MVLFDDQREAVAWIVDDGYLSIYLHDGTPMAWVVEDTVYSFSGRYLGYIEDGWVWDRAGYAVMFTSMSDEAADLTSRRVPPPKALRKPRPPTDEREAPPPRAGRRTEWSAISGEAFLRQVYG